MSDSRSPVGSTTLLILFLLLPFTSFTPPLAFAQATTWIAGDGEWGDAVSWSDGVPDADTDAEVPDFVTVNIHSIAAACRNLTTGTTAAGSDLWIYTGSLTVAERFHVGSAAESRFDMAGGTVSVGRLLVGDTDVPALCRISHGSLTVGDLTVGANGSSASATMMVEDSPGTVVNVTGSINIEDGGTFFVREAPTIVANGFTMTSGASLGSYIYHRTGVSTIVVHGTASLAGNLSISTDWAGGTFELLRADSIQGSFDAVYFPGDSWTWRIENNSVFVTNHATPVETATWGRIKRQYRR